MGNNVTNDTLSAWECVVNEWTDAGQTRKGLRAFGARSPHHRRHFSRTLHVPPFGPPRVAHPSVSHFVTIRLVAGLLLLDLGELLHAAVMSAVSKSGREEDLDDLSDVLFAEQVGAETQDVAMVVLARPAGGHFVVGEGGADASHFIGGDGHADAAAVHEDADLGLTAGDGPCGGGGKVGVIAGRRPVASEVRDLVPLLLEHRQQPAFGLKASMITCDRNLHSCLIGDNRPRLMELQTQLYKSRAKNRRS